MYKIAVPRKKYYYICIMRDNYANHAGATPPKCELRHQVLVLCSWWYLSFWWHDLIVRLKRFCCLCMMKGRYLGNRVYVYICRIRDAKVAYMHV